MRVILPNPGFVGVKSYLGRLCIHIHIRNLKCGDPKKEICFRAS